MPTLKHVELLEKSSIRYGYRLAVLANWFKNGPHDLSKKQFGLNESENAVLFCLAQCSGLNATDVCQITGRLKNNVSRAIHVLIERGFVTSSPDVRDKRSKLLDVTESGYTVYRFAEAVFISSEKRLLRALSSEDLTALDILLSKMLQDAVSWPTPK